MQVSEGSKIGESLQEKKESIINEEARDKRSNLDESMQLYQRNKDLLHHLEEVRCERRLGLGLNFISLRNKNN